VNPAAPLDGWVISLDLWGTLLDHGDRAAAMDWRINEFGRVLASFGHALPDELLRRTVTSADAEAARAQRAHGAQPPAPAGQVAGILRALGITPRADLVAVLAVVHAHAVLRACPQPAPGARTALAALAGTGARVVLTSNTLSTPGEVHRQLLTDLDLAGYFDDLLFSGDLGIAKPRPEVFAAVAARAGTTPGRVIHAGDDWDTDVRGALAAGCRAVYYHPHGPARPQAPGIARLDQLTGTLHDVACRPAPACTPLETP
jgi:putative hydrolase of the HAD superfamily